VKGYRVKKFWPGSGWVNFLFFCCSGWVVSDIFGLVLRLENFPQKSQNFQFFSFGLKKYLKVGSKSTQVKDRSPLIYCGSKVCSSWVRAHLYLSISVLTQAMITHGNHLYYGVTICRLLFPWLGVPHWLFCNLGFCKICTYGWGSNPQPWILVYCLVPYTSQLWRHLMQLRY